MILQPWSLRPSLFWSLWYDALSVTLLALYVVVDIEYFLRSPLRHHKHSVYREGILRLAYRTDNRYRESYPHFLRNHHLEVTRIRKSVPLPILWNFLLALSNHVVNWSFSASSWNCLLECPNLSINENYLFRIPIEKTFELWTYLPREVVHAPASTPILEPFSWCSVRVQTSL